MNWLSTRRDDVPDHLFYQPRKPQELSALPAYFAGCYLYKRSNRLWRFLIKHQLVHAVWRPLVEVTRLRHLAFRRRLEAQTETRKFSAGCAAPFPASV